MPTVVSQLRFKNGHAFTIISVNSDGLRFIQGLNRQVIDAQFDSVIYDSIRGEIEIPGNTDELTIIQDTTNDDAVTAVPATDTTPAIEAVPATVTHREFSHNDYSIVQHLGIDLYTVSAATNTSAEVGEYRTSLLLAQLTYLEVLQRQQAAAQAQSDQAILELSIYIAGGNTGLSTEN
jgi:hypothetical protein